MRIDLYTKTVLTIIALCLVWIALGSATLLSPVHAQVSHADGVAVSGWIDANGTEHRLPAPGGGPSAQPIPVTAAIR